MTNRKECRGPLVMSALGGVGLVVVWAQIFPISQEIVQYSG